MEQCKKCLAHIFLFPGKKLLTLYHWKENLFDFQKI